MNLFKGHLKMESVPWSLGVGDTAVRFVNKNIRTHSTAYTGAGSQAGSNRANFFSILDGNNPNIPDQGLENERY